MIKKLFNKYSELIFWITAMVCLAFTNPANHSHFSLCPFSLMGITWCPGCGLGHAIAWFFHGEISKSFHAHWLGIPAVVIIFHRIGTILKSIFYPYEWAANTQSINRKPIVNN